MNNPTPLTKKEIAAFLVVHPQWHHIDSVLRGVLEFDTFLATINFVNQLAEVAESLQHHPTMVIEYNKLTIETTTHDVGNQITERDTDLVGHIEQLLEGE
jgi:4a-hydroxytetrahydrobiopterin dehydratase